MVRCGVLWGAVNKQQPVCGVLSMLCCCACYAACSWSLVVLLAMLLQLLDAVTCFRWQTGKLGHAKAMQGTGTARCKLHPHLHPGCAAV